MVGPGRSIPQQLLARAGHDGPVMTGGLSQAGHQAIHFMRNRTRCWLRRASSTAASNAVAPQKQSNIFHTYDASTDRIPRFSFKRIPPFPGADVATANWPVSENASSLHRGAEPLATPRNTRLLRFDSSAAPLTLMNGCRRSRATCQRCVMPAWRTVVTPLYMRQLKSWGRPTASFAAAFGGILCHSIRSHVWLRAVSGHAPDLLAYF